MFKRQSVKLQKIPTRPTDVDLQRFVDTSVRDRETRYNYFWKDSVKNSEYIISVRYVPTGDGAMEWRMYQGSGPDAKEVWMHITTDLSVIYSMIVKAVGGELAEAVQEDARITQKGLKKIQPKSHAVPQSTTTFGSMDPVTQEELDRFRIRAREEALGGDLKLVHITNLLQSIALGQMTGRLKIHRKRGSAEVYFDRGQPVHAIGTLGEGEDSLLQVIGWQEGEFHFEPNIKTDSVTVNQSLNWIIMNGVKLQDNTDFLKSLDLTGDSILTRCRPETTEHEFELIMARGEPLDMTLLKSYYLTVDDRRSLKEINDKFNLPRSRWVPVIANLVKLGMVAVKQASRGERVVVEPKQIDRQAIDSAMRMVMRPDTGLFIHPAFLYFLERTLELRNGLEQSLSLVVFEARATKTGLGSVSSAPAPQAIQEMVRRINELKRPTDLLAHYEGNDYVLMLPDCKPIAAQVLVERILQSLETSSWFRAMDSGSAPLCFGIAALPDDVDNMGSLLSAAEQAKHRAKASGKRVLVHGNA